MCAVVCLRELQLNVDKILLFIFGNTAQDVWEISLVVLVVLGIEPSSDIRTSCPLFLQPQTGTFQLARKAISLL